MSRDEWDALALLIEHGWKGDFDEVKSSAYFMLLRRYERLEVETALEALLHAGSPFTPSASEIVQQIDKQTGPPTFDEMWPKLLRITFSHYADEQRALKEIQAQCGETVAGWVAAYGFRRLLNEPINHDDHGGAVVHRLREHYAATAETPDGRRRLEATLRERLVLGGGPRRGELHQLNPGAALAASLQPSEEIA